MESVPGLHPRLVRADLAAARHLVVLVGLVLLLALVRPAVRGVEARGYARRVVAPYLHEVYLAARRPVEVLRVVLRQAEVVAEEPQRRPCTPSARHLRAELDASVVERPHGLQVRRGVLAELALTVPAAKMAVLVERIRPLLLACGDREDSVLNAAVLHAVGGVVLRLLVADEPDLRLPVRGVWRRVLTVELVRPLELPALLRIRPARILLRVRLRDIRERITRGHSHGKHYQCILHFAFPFRSYDGFT